MRRLVAVALLLVSAALLVSATNAADEGWIVERFASEVNIQADGSLLVTENIDVNFQGLTDRHGIFREIPVRYRWDPDPKFVRVYQVDVQSVRDLNGRAVNYQTSPNGANLRIKK